MTAASQAVSPRPAVRQADIRTKPGIAKIIAWTLLFQLAWHFRMIPTFLKEGNFADSDDFLRLHEVRNWLGGQGWFDVSVPRMNPPAGGDLHWSRLVDVPIAGLTWFFDLFTDTILAERLAAIAWPTILLVLTVLAILAVCEKLYPAANRMLALLFTVTCITAMVEFAPARIDHHNIQILLFSMIMLGLVNAERKWGHYLIGASMALSLVIGLDLLLMLALILAWLGLEWVIGIDRNGSGMMRTGLALTSASLILYPVSVPSSAWFIANCDAISIFYLAVLLLTAAGFTVLSLASRLLPSSDTPTWPMIASRAVAGAVAGAAVVAVLFSLYPHCAAGPMAGISAELKTVWLDSVIEAKGLMASARELDAGLYAMPLFMIMNLVLGLVFIRRGMVNPRFIAIWAAILITLFLGFLQIRTLRIGMFATVPVGVIAAQLAWHYFARRYSESRPLALAAGSLATLLLISPAWLIAGKMIAAQFAPGNSPAGNAGQIGKAEIIGELPAWASDPQRVSCNRQSDFAPLAALPKGHVFNAINIGPAILVFTDHAMIGANYHRNGEAILATHAFFNSPAGEARLLAEAKKIDYVVMCKAHPLDMMNVERDARLGSRLLHGDMPDWLEALSADDDRLLIARMLR